MFDFIFTAVMAVCSLGLIFGVDKLMGNSDSLDTLRSCSPLKSLQRDNFKSLIKKLDSLEKKVKKIVSLEENAKKKSADKNEARN